jgi:hypothetical protein
MRHNRQPGEWRDRPAGTGNAQPAIVLAGGKNTAESPSHNHFRSRSGWEKSTILGSGIGTMNRPPRL